MMKNKIRIAVTLTLVFSMMAATLTSYAFEVRSGSTTVYSVEDLRSEGLGSSEKPIDYVDGTGESFSSWAGSKYFTPDCEFKNITVTDGAGIQLMPVYGGTKSATLNGNGGTVAGASTKALTVNFDDATIDAEKEIVSQDDTKDLSALLAGTTAAYEGYYPYFYAFDNSTLNKRIFFDSDASKTETTDKLISEAKYDVNGAGTLYVIWKDTVEAKEWKQAQTDKAKFVAYDSRYATKAAYYAAFGGKLSGASGDLPYGTFGVKKELPGIDHYTVSWNWTLKKGEDTKKELSGQEFSHLGVAKDLDGAKLTEVVKYGPSGEAEKYQLTTDPIEYIVYGRPVVSAAVIE